ncbi:MAG: hypothetical protein ACI9R3_004910 [Verrucomicrobiales bacterium]|jgi:hypothetical protein
MSQFQIALTSTFILSLSALPCCAQLFDFSEGNDDGWERLDPLTEADVPSGTFAFPDGGYQMTHPASPSPDELGNARIGSFRPDVVQNGDFHIRVDVTNWDDGEDQNLGILAMINDPGLGTTNSYALTLDLSEQALYLSLIDFETPSIVANTPLSDTLTPDVGFRIIFERVDGEMTGNIYALTDLESSLATVEGFDDFIESGSPGLIASVDPPEGAIDVTFDNFSVSPEGTIANGETPGVFQLEVEADTVRVHFGPVQANTEYQILSSQDFKSWSEVADEFEPGATAETGVFEFARQPGQDESYYQIAFPAE